MTLSHTSQRWDDEQWPCTRIESAGMMIHLTTWTRPELASVVSSLAKDSDPCRCGWVHVRAMARVVAYIAGTTSLGLRYVGSDTEDPGMVAWVDGGIGQGLPRDGAAAITDTVPNRLRQHGGMRGVRERGGIFETEVYRNPIFPDSKGCPLGTVGTVFCPNGLECCRPVHQESRVG